MGHPNLTFARLFAQGAQQRRGGGEGSRTTGETGRLRLRSITIAQYKGIKVMNKIKIKKNKEKYKGKYKTVKSGSEERREPGMGKEDD